MNATETYTAWEQVGSFACLVILGYWLVGMDHTDGYESLERRATWKEHAYKIDPGMALSRRKQTT